MLGKDLGEPAGQPGSHTEARFCQAGSLDAASESEEEARDEAGVAAGTRAGAGDKVVQGAVTPMFSF